MKNKQGDFQDLEKRDRKGLEKREWSKLPERRDREKGMEERDEGKESRKRDGGTGMEERDIEN